MRRSALQHYMEQLAAHPVISRSEVHACTGPKLPGQGRVSVAGVQISKG